MIDFNALALSPCIAAFGKPIVYQPGAGMPVTLIGIFNEAAMDEKITGDGQVVQERVPTVAINLRDLPFGMPLPCRNEIVMIGERMFQIGEPLKDNFGHLLLKLKVVTR